MASPDAMVSAAGEAPAWQERHRGLVAGLAAALLGKTGQSLGPLMRIAVEEASSSALKAMLLEIKTQVTHLYLQGAVRTGTQFLSPYHQPRLQCWLTSGRRSLSAMQAAQPSGIPEILPHVCM